ncbi:hypothetical protein Tco_1201425 [Tanacetum coccineum]
MFFNIMIDEKLRTQEVVDLEDMRREKKGKKEWQEVRNTRSKRGYLQKILNNYKVDNGKSLYVSLGAHFKVEGLSVDRMKCGNNEYLTNLCKTHYEAVTWILKYLKGTVDVGLVYGRNQGKHVDVDSFVDADYAKDPDKGRLITGYMFMVHGCVVSWKATLQHVVALSTTQEDYMALTEAVKESIWLKCLLIELGINLRKIEVAKIGTKDNAADTFTKMVLGPKFKYCMEILDIGAN